MTRFRGGPLKSSLGILIALVFISAPALAEGDNLGFEPQYWDQSMDGTMRVDGDTLEGTRIDLPDGLGLEEKDRLPAGRIWIHWLKRNYLTFTAYHSERNGDEVLASPLVFNDQTFPAGEQVKSRVETDLKSLLYGYDFLDHRLVKMGFRLGVDRLGFDAKLDSSSSPAAASSSESVTVPVAGLGIVFEPIPLLRFTGEISGISGSFNGNEVTFYDARIQAEIYWWHFFGIITGYRRMKTDVDLESFGTADVTQKGPYAGFVFRF
jgi:hypothetical protein